MARRRLLVNGGLIVLLCMFALCFVALPCVWQVRDGEGYVRSQNSLMSIGHALANYSKINGRLPPTAIRDKEGRPLLSWRVLLLPYLEKDDLYGRFRLDEPWDGPNNKHLAEETPRCYEPALGGVDPPGLTRYRVLVGPGTAFERDGLSWSDFPDGRENTLLVVEAAESVPWSKPVDLAYRSEEPLPLLECPYRKPVNIWRYTIERRPGFNALFADGSVRFIKHGTSEEVIRSLITRNGGEKVDVSRLDSDARIRKAYSGGDEER